MHISNSSTADSFSSVMIKGVLCIVCAAGLWGMGGVSGQYLYTYHDVDSIWLVMIRQIIGGILFLLYSACVQKQDVVAALRSQPRDMLEFSFIGILASQLGFYYMVSLCNAATATVLQYTAPIYVMLWMSYTNHRCPEKRELMGIVLALLGVFLIATHGSLDSLALSPYALFIGVLSAVGYAYYSIKPVEMLKQHTATTIIGWGQLLSGLSLLAFRNPFTPAGNWDMHAVLAVTYLILGATVGSYGLYLKGLPRVGPTKASLISCFEPLASISAVVLLLGTKLAKMDYVGMGCIIVTVLLLALNQESTQKQTT